jgi:hypothetical protein
MCSATRRRTPRSGSRRLAHVVLGDPALRPCACDRLEVDAELLGQPADQRRRPNAFRTATQCLSLCLSLCLSPGLVPGCRGAVFADHDQNGSDRHDVALGDQDPRDLAAGRRGDLDRRLVGLHLDERVVLVDLLSLGDQPTGDLALGQPLTEVRQLELVGHA